MEHIAISGYGCLSAAGGTAELNYQNILDGIRNYSYDQGVTNSQGVVFPVFPIPEEDLPQGYDALPESMRCGELAVAAAREGLTHAGIDQTAINDLRIGVCLGTTGGNALNNDPFYRDYIRNKFPEIQPIIEFRQANPAAYTSRKLGLTGPSMTLTNACSSGAIAIAQGMEWIESGLCDVVIAGGAEKLCPVICHGFASLLIADRSPCKPFDAARGGLSLAAGAGVLILESDQSLQARNAPVISRLIGYGNRCDSYHLSAPDPAGTGLRAALTAALEACALSVNDLAFINAHGTGTVENDAMEESVYSDLAPGIPYFSIKGSTGHTLGASGGIEAVLTVMFLNRGHIPGTAGFSEMPSTFHSHPIKDSQPIEGDTAMTTSVGFGGNCGVLIFKRECDI